MRYPIEAFRSSFRMREPLLPHPGATREMQLAEKDGRNQKRSARPKCFDGSAKHIGSPPSDAFLLARHQIEKLITQWPLKPKALLTA